MDNEDYFWAWISCGDGQAAQVSLSNSAFVHGRAIHNAKDEMITVIYNHLEGDPADKCDGLKKYTGTNQPLIKSEQQYGSYCDTFGTIVRQ